MSQAVVKRVLAGSVVTAGVLALGITGASAAVAVPPEEGEAPACAVDQLKLGAGEPVPAGAQHRITLSLKNISDRTCSVDGLPAVDLTGPADPVFGDTYRLAPGARPGGFAVLVPGQGEEVAEVTVLGGGSWTPKAIEATPPGQDAPLLLEWPGLPVLRQDGATHPGSFVQGIG
ncbi:DUF4232 domain-containing protein [Amycolatopsis sp. 195334CR]|uniref:DUF4232 domain-containing protein n=1 Tax=Amycolatopsis sp. 195334CR TaxID=2814588 RepID=UPI001A8FDBFD|nr:DUF4232 domain-containing protein [Amycolatopsis sp. 195334CR]MBN6037624.1 DUF4232 domain-containing protein [Amycolatopsis sp. 195334CR]